MVLEEELPVILYGPVNIAAIYSSEFAVEPAPLICSFKRAAPQGPPTTLKLDWS